MYCLELGNLFIPFEKSSPPAGMLIRPAIQFPDFINNMIAVSIYNMCSFVSVSCQMILNNAFCGHGVDIFIWIESMIKRADVDIVDIQQDSAISLFRQTGQELPLCHG